MSATAGLEKSRTPKRFYFLMVLIYFPVFYCLTVIEARWYGFVIAALSFAALLSMRRSAVWHGWHIPLCFALAFVVALMGLYFSRPRWDVSLPGQIGTGTLRVFASLAAESEKDFGETSSWKTPEGYVHSMIELPHCGMETLRPEGEGSGYAVLQLHGGAFVSGMNDLYRMMARRYCDLAGGAEVLTPDYRLSPAYGYPTQQNDAMDAWRYLTEILGYQANRIILVGDSAGGNLVLNLALRLRDAGEPLPAAVIALSPWADLSDSGPSHIQNAVNDPTFGFKRSDYDGVTPVGVNSDYARGLDARDPFLSPSFADYHGFPPMLLQAGEMEVLLSDSEMIYQNATRNRVDCTLTVYPGMFHVFQGSLELLPESREAWEEIGEFIARVLAGGTEEL